MKTMLHLWLLIGALALAGNARAQNDRGEKRLHEITNILKSLKYQQGEINIRGGLAKLQLPKEFNYLGPDDAEKVLHKLWGNPPGSHTLGLIIPANKTPVDQDCWVVTISYSEDGYVKDDDANKINYDDLLKKMQKETREYNAERKKEGYPSMELVGWAEPPRYDAATHKLYWAKDLRVEDESQDALNYNIRILGRRGVLVLNAVSSISQLQDIKAETPRILSMVNFNDGNRYADFDPKVDKVATYGIAALVAGGIAAKLGLFAKLFAILLAAKKLIVVAVVAVGAWLKKLFTGDTKRKVE